MENIMTSIKNNTKEKRGFLNKEIKGYLEGKGAIGVGFATKETMHSPEGIPSADITSILPEAESAICFAFPLDKKKIQAYLNKDLPNGRVDHNKDNFDTYIKIIKISEELKKTLEKKGYIADIILPNFDYRGEGLRSTISQKPYISLRYLAVRSGVGTFGWSGNVLMKGYGAPILLGGVVTNAKLEPTDPIPESESVCNNCKLCTKVCAFRFMSDDEQITVTLGGQTFDYSKRKKIARCLMVCGGYSGLDKTGKWSTWCPERHPYPETDDDVYKIFAKELERSIRFHVRGEHEGFDRTQLDQDPVLKQIFSGKEQAARVFKFTNLSCGNCQMICWGDPEQTAENYRMLVNSGCTIRDDEGYIEVRNCDEAKNYYEEKHPDIDQELTPKQKEYIKLIKESNET